MPGLWKAASTALAPFFRPAGTIIEGVNPGDWASPQNPIRPTSQLVTGVRQWDFTPGINLQFTPRGDVAIKFGHLWAVSNSFDLCRLMIETRKDQIVNRPWSIRVKAKEGEPKAARLKRQAGNPNVAKVTQLLKKPDGVNRFDIWIRMWLEQLLVFDAPCIYPVRNRLGDVFQLRLISGTTITPLLDEEGFRPAPPQPAYQQIILGIPVSNLSASGEMPGKMYGADQLIYSPRNPRVDSRWGFSPVEQIITTLSIAANRQQFMREYYTSGNVPEGLLPMPESWTMAQIKDFQKWFDSLLSGNLGKKRRITMIPDAKHPVQFSKSEALTDVTDDYLIRVVAFAFSITPQNLIKQVNRGTAKESSDVAQIEGLEPYLKHIENTINSEVIETQLGLEDIEFAYDDEREMDPVKQAQVDEIYVNTGISRRNEIRQARGEDPDPAPEADMLTVTTATGIQPLDVGQAVARMKALTPEPPPQAPGKAPQNNAKVRKIAPLSVTAGDLTPRSRHVKHDFSRKLGALLAGQSKRIAAQARAGFLAQKAAEPDLTKGDTEDDTAKALAILAMLDWRYPELADLALPALEEAAAEGANAGSYQTHVAFGTSLAEVTEVAASKAQDDARKRAYELAGLGVMDDGTIAEATGAKWAMSTTAKDDVLNAIKQAIQEDWTPNQLQAVIEGLPIFNQLHADLVSDNEVSRQQVQGTVQAWKASKMVLEYAWMVQDMGCCPLCAEFSLKGNVPVGHEFASMIYGPPGHPGCRCSLKATKFAEGEE